MSSISDGYRGYIGSRPYNGDRVPQHVQNLVIRDFCQKHGFTYLLSATEYAMDSCYIMLEEVMREASDLDGIVLYSILMLPENRERRQDFMKRFLDQGCSIYGAVENQKIETLKDMQRIEDIWRVKSAQEAFRL